MQLVTDPRVPDVFDNYPTTVKAQMQHLRTLVLAVANEVEEINTLEETLKWGEPSYLTKHGSTIRMDWKPRTPKQYAIYFKCTANLVPTFKQLYPNTFRFEGNRAIIFNLDEDIPAIELKHCLQIALRYHKLKHLPLLGQ